MCYLRNWFWVNEEMIYAIFVLFFFIRISHHYLKLKWYPYGLEYYVVIVFFRGSSKYYFFPLLGFVITLLLLFLNLVSPNFLNLILEKDVMIIIGSAVFEKLRISKTEKMSFRKYYGISKFESMITKVQ